MALAVAEIADSIRATRAEFNRLFLQTQIDFVADPGQRVEFEAIATSGIDAEAFKHALAYAQVRGWLDTLVNSLVEEGLEDGRLAQSLVADAEPGNAPLQAMTNIAAGFTHPEVLYRGVASGMRWTVKVLVDEKAEGTGVLIGPHLVLTAWHVVRSMFLPEGNGWKPDPNAASRLQVEFDDFLKLVRAGALGARPTTRVPASNPNWYVVHSHCHNEELKSKLPANLSDLEGLWDYAVIRLAKAPGIERRWAPLDGRAVVPKNDAHILVFQHPAGQPLRCDQNDIVAPKPNNQGAIPRLRFLHRANTAPGSSGGPCFDKTFMLFGLHQGVWDGADGGNAINRGVPIVGVREDLRRQIQDLPPPDPSTSPVWHLGPTDLHQPVIGCDPFQAIVWRAAIAGNPRVIAIMGDPGAGKSHRLRVLSSMLPDGGHLKVDIDAPNLSKRSALDLASAICKAAGATVPQFVSMADFATTPTTWLKDEVVRKTIDSLDGARAGRLVWLSIADLNKTDIQGENASPFLVAIYEQARTVEWLRIVLDGMKGDVPATIRPISVADNVVIVTEEDLKAYLQRAVADLGLVPDPFAITVSAKSAMNDFRGWRTADSSTAMSKLASKAMSIVDDYLNAAGG